MAFLLQFLTLTKVAQLTCVFVVDDEPLIARTMGEILRMSGVRVRIFTAPNDALEAALTDRPDVLISDLLMPHSSGIDLARNIVEIWPRCRVLLRSGQPQSERLLQETNDKGYTFHLLMKPAHPMDLLAHLRHLIPDLRETGQPS